MPRQISLSKLFRSSGQDESLKNSYRLNAIDSAPRKF